jgi:hypothetical protein
MVHTLITAALCWAIWTTRNKVTFDEYILKTPVVIVFLMCLFLLYWEGLYDPEDADVIRGGAKKLVAKAVELARQT